MNTGVKITIYAILVSLTCICGFQFFKNFGKLFEDEKPAVVAAPAPAVEGTNDTTTNVVADIATNAPIAEITNAVAAVETNAPPAADTNAVAATEPVITTARGTNANAQAPKEKSRVGFWTGSFVLCVIALGGFIAWDVSSFMGNRTLKVIYNDDGDGMKDVEYDEAEQMWANGQPLEAIRMMRDHLNKNPREVHVALRIAEIYEKDLDNFLAAALEYEEVLKKKLEAERWGWAAIHLCNLYFKLGQEDKAYVLLQRVVKEYGQTQAADKARKRLADAAPHLLAEAQNSNDGPADDTAPAPRAKVPASEEPKQVSNLPPGFRPKK
jgi:TolA-binding protein